MKLTSIATLTVLVVGHVYASPVEDVLSPSGIPATSGLPFSTLSFDTTAAPSLLSALSSLISSESTAVTPTTPLTSHSVPIPTTSGSVIITETTLPSPTTTPTPTTITTSISPTGTSGAHRLRDVRSGLLTGVVVGAVAALL